MLTHECKDGGVVSHMSRNLVETNVKRLTVLCRLTLEVPAMPLNLKAPMPHTSIGSCLVGKGLPRAELGVHTGHLASAYSLQLVTAGW